MSEVELYPGRISPLGLGTIPHDDIQKYTGLELLQRLVDGKYPAPPISFALNFTLAEVSEGRAVFRGMPGERHLNPLGMVHGGWAATLLDSITPKTGEVVCEGNVGHKGRTLAVSEATLKDANGKLLAFGTETCSIFPVGNLAAR